MDTSITGPVSHHQLSSLGDPQCWETVSLFLWRGLGKESKAKVGVLKYLKSIRGPNKLRRSLPLRRGMELRGNTYTGCMRLISPLVSCTTYIAVNVIRVGAYGWTSREEGWSSKSLFDRHAIVRNLQKCGQNQGDVHGHVKEWFMCKCTFERQRHVKFPCKPFLMKVV